MDDSILAPSPTLRLALRADAAVSGAAGIVQLLGGSALAATLGMPAPLLAGTGIFMLGYASLLVWLAAGTTRATAWIALIVFGNLGWAGGCIAMAVAQQTSFSGPGHAYLAFNAAVVAALAAWQAAGWRASPSASRSRHAHG